MMLTAKDFRPIGRAGIGNPRAKVAHCMAWFDGALYLGVTHHRGEGRNDRARILRYDPDRDQWDTVFTSPLVDADERADPQDVLRRRRRPRQLEAKVPKFRGFRSMTVFQAPSDPAPALYVSTICHWGAVILRSADGETFEPVTEPGMGDDSLLSFRSLLGFKGKLFCAATGAIRDGKLDRNFAGEATVYVSADPLGKSWAAAMEPGFGDPGNTSISRIAVFGEHLYVSLGNPERGFQLWRTEAVGPPPFSWECVLRDGAGRYNLNETAPTMAEFNGALYISTGLPGMGYDSANDVGPAAAEMLRVNGDGSWDLIAGTPRFTRDGFKVPFAAAGPGFGDFYNSVFWSMAVHDGVLYAGSHHWGAFEAMMKRGAAEGGYQIWASDDGDQWTPVTVDGLGDPFEIGIRSMISTPLGLVIGTSNHGEIARFRGRRAEPDSSGFEVWLAQ